MTRPSPDRGAVDGWEPEPPAPDGAAPSGPTPELRNSLFALGSKILRGEGIFARAVRSSAWTITGYGASQALRLASNLILTRLLFPEAFGLMALVSVFMQGLVMFSDIGLGPAIAQNKRGDDPSFLNTAWTIQVIRGVGLWLGSLAIALPVARFYGEPMLAELLPVVGLSLLISGFNPTRLETANRHLMLGRVVMLDLVSQVISIIAIIGLALALRSVWALVIGGVIGTVVRLVLTHSFLPGMTNRFLWEKDAAHELIRFGKWIFLSTVCGFLVAQGDKAVLGKYLTLELLGIYNVGFFLASFPLLLGIAVSGRIMIPLYRESSPTASTPNFRRLRMMRLGLTGAVLSLQLLMAFFGVALVEFLYDPRYAAAGGVVVLVACLQIPQIIGMSYDHAALAAGASRPFFFVLFVKAVVQMTFVLVGVETAGLIGALLGQGLALLLLHPLVIWLARRYGAWDGVHDLVYATLGLGLAASALWLHRDAIAALASFG